jgi:nitrous oxidase accessory protein NosD
MLGLAPTYVSAQVIVAALAKNDQEAAFAELGKYAGTELQLVSDKAIALGADPDAVGLLLGALTGETIEVTGEAPVIPSVKRKTRWKWLVGIAAGIAVLGTIGYKLKKKH